jgi:hypothetical protein
LISQLPAIALKTVAGGAAASMRRRPVFGIMSRHGQVILIGALLAVGLGARLNAQTQLVDPKDAPKIFSSTCSACHKSPAGLAKSGQVAGFLRQHYTTGPEMSAAMAAYLVAAGSGPAAKKGEAKAKEQNENPAAKGKKKQEQAAVQPGDRTGEPRSEAREPRSDAKSNAKEQRTLRGKQLQQAKAHEERPTVHPSPAAVPAPEASPPTPPASAAAEQPAQTASVPAAAAAPAAATPAAAAPAAPPMVTLDSPLPEMPTAPPADLSQSVFSSSPVP